MESTFMRLALDIETNTAHDKIWVCCTYDIDTKEVRTWTSAQDFNQFIQKAKLLIAHNGICFDFPVLNRVWKTTIKLNQVQDTLVMSRLSNPSRDGGHSLAKLAKLVGRTKKEFADFEGGLSDDMIYYCQEDVRICGDLYLYLQQELKGFSEQSIELEHKVQAIIARQERHGFKLDTVKAQCLLGRWKRRLSDIEEELQKVFPPIVTQRFSEKTGKQLKDDVEVFNPGSRQQIAKRLMDLGWKPTKHTEKGAVIVDEAVLDGVDIPEAKLIAEYLLLQKRVAQVESWLEFVSDEHRVHGKVITNGAVTGRMTHHSPNMAQVPSSSSPWGVECRDCWTVDEGKTLVGADAASLELRMLAHYMKDEQYAREIIEGDIHTKNQTAAGLQTRAQAKTFIYALLYGAGPTKIGKIVGGSAKEGQELISNFLRNTPALKHLREKIERLSEKGTLPGLDGRQLQVRSAHAALNTLLQSAGAIVMKQGLVLLDSKLRKFAPSAQFVANVHDEWQIECDEADADLVGELAVSSIKEAGQVLGLRCPLDGEYKKGKTWANTH
jgi:DNA polymerase I-like protein with 3'-5' exonuclease and polymerase domains